MTAPRALRAWSCFILIFVLLLAASKLVMPVNTWLAQFSSSVTVFSGDDPSTVTFMWVNTPGVGSSSRPSSAASFRALRRA